MGRRITSLKESPCFKCEKHTECLTKVENNNQFSDIVDQVFGNRDFDYYNCPLYIALTAPDIVDETEVDDG